MVDNLTTSDEILGKEVLDLKGGIIGIVQKIHIDRGTKKIIGITIDEGFLKPQLFVGVDKISFFGLDAVILNNEFTSYKGIKVFDSKGNDVGNVKEVLTGKTGKIKKIIVNSHKGIFEIEVSKIKTLGENVILK